MCACMKHTGSVSVVLFWGSLVALLVWVGFLKNPETCIKWDIFVHLQNQALIL